MSETAEAFTYDPGWDEEEKALNTAILNVVTRKMTIRNAANKSGVSLLKLWDKILNIKSEDEKGEEILTVQEEKQIAQMMREATNGGCQPSVEDFIYSVKSVLDKKGRFLSLKNNRPNKEWIIAFLERHRGIALKPSQDSRESTIEELKTVLEGPIKKEIVGGDFYERLSHLSSSDVLQRAVTDVKSKRCGVFTAAKLYRISPTTLWKEVRGEETNSTATGRLTALSVEEEAEIAYMIKGAIRRGLVVTPLDVRETVKAYLDSKGKTYFKFQNNLPSKTWVSNFQMRNPGINISCRLVKSGAGEASPNVPSTSKNTTNSAPPICISSVVSLSEDNDLPFETGPGCSNPTSSAPGLPPSSAKSSANDADERFICDSTHKSSTTSSTKASHVSTVSNASTDVDCYIIPSSTSSQSMPLSASTLSNTIDTAATNMRKHSAENEIEDSTPSGNSDHQMGETVSGNSDALASSGHATWKSSSSADSIFSVFKRLTMMNFSFGEDRVLKYFSYLERRANYDDVDFVYWKNLVLRVIPSWSSSAPASQRPVCQHALPVPPSHVPVTQAPLNQLPLPQPPSSQPSLPEPPPHYHSGHNFEARTDCYTSHNHYNAHAHSAYNSFDSHSSGQYYNYHKRPQHQQYSHKQYPKRPRKQNKYNHQNCIKNPPKQNNKEAQKATKTKEKDVTEDLEMEENINASQVKRTKDKKEKKVKSQKRDKKESKKEKPEIGKKEKSENKKEKKIKRKYKEIDEGDTTEENQSSKGDRHHKKKKKDKKTVQEKVKSDKREKKEKKPKEKQRKTAEDNSVIRVEVDMKGSRKRIVFNDSSDED